MKNGQSETRETTWGAPQAPVVVHKERLFTRVVVRRPFENFSSQKVHCKKSRRVVRTFT